MQTTEFMELEAPAKLDSGKGEGSVPLGSVLFRDDRRDYFLYVDEFQNFVSGSFASILSEARKY